MSAPETSTATFQGQPAAPSKGAGHSGSVLKEAKYMRAQTRGKTEKHVESKYLT